MSETGLKTFLPRIDSKVRLAIERIRDENTTRGAADIAKWFMFLSFDVIGDLAFGESFGNLESGKVCYFELRKLREGQLTNNAEKSLSQRLRQLRLRRRSPVHVSHHRQNLTLSADSRL